MKRAETSPQAEHRSTICAIATPAGGAIGIVRISGSSAVACADRIFRTASGVPLSARSGGSICFGNVVESDGSVVDEVLVSIFHAPRSYTGEDCVEISCHGSGYILQRVCALLLAQGCVMAEPGEFTKRAFLNGKMDLSRAEAVADVINADSAASHRVAIAHLRGDVSNALGTLRSKLLHLLTLLELELDFSDHEDLEFADRGELLALAGEMDAHIGKLIGSFERGNALKNGISVAIVGGTNVGKSTLLNRLVGEERAIVSDIHGTTRDTLVETRSVGGIMFRFIDTAGLRATENEIERIGIERARREAERAELVLWVIDAARCSEADGLGKEVSSWAQASCLSDGRDEGRKVLVVLNKCDLPEASAEPAPLSLPHVRISAKTGAGMEQLERMLAQFAERYNTPETIITNLRHAQALISAREALSRAVEGLRAGISGEFVSQDLRLCAAALGEITGEVTSADVLHSVFANFCIGK